MKRTLPDKEEPSSKRSKEASFSSVLEAIVGRDGIDTFLDNVYQEIPKLFTSNDIDESLSIQLKALLSLTFDDVCEMLLHTSQSNLNSFNDEIQGEEIDPRLLPLFFRNRNPVQQEEANDIYGNNPFAAYLDGCSVVNNHADLIMAPLAALCNDLQKTFPHVYINTYLTPPNAAAVKAHADDRDVLVIQVLGEKQWKVYNDVPIKYPNNHEQVGKNGLKVPEEILNKKPLFDITLKAGDILYMPRGYVHEAETSESEPSFHCTVAIATHDWTLSKTIAQIVTKQLESDPQFRKAVYPSFGMKPLDEINSDKKTELSDLIQNAIGRIQSNITVEKVSETLSHKYDLHNKMVCGKRQSIIHEKTSSRKIENGLIVGPEAAKTVTMESRIRASTETEKATAPPPRAKHGRCLTVREETCDSLLSLLAFLRSDKNLIKVSDMRRVIENSDKICDLTILSFVKCCVELGAMAIEKL